MKTLFTLTILALLLPMSVLSEETPQAQSEFYDFSFKSIDGKEINFQDFKGKPVVVINTACLCGFTKQFSDIEKLHQGYKDKGLIVIGVPSDDFGGQELDSENEVKEFLDSKFKPTFVLTEISKVKGKEAHPFYKWASKKTSMLGTPKWNFHKYLIGKDGEFIDWFASSTSPTSSKIKKAIEESLSKD